MSSVHADIDQEKRFSFSSTLKYKEATIVVVSPSDCGGGDRQL